MNDFVNEEGRPSTHPADTQRGYLESAGLLWRRLGQATKEAEGVSIAAERAMLLRECERVTEDVEAKDAGELGKIAVDVAKLEDEIRRQPKTPDAVFARPIPSATVEGPSSRRWGIGRLIVPAAAVLIAVVVGSQLVLPGAERIPPPHSSPSPTRPGPGSPTPSGTATPLPSVTATPPPSVTTTPPPTKPAPPKAGGSGFGALALVSAIAILVLASVFLRRYGWELVARMLTASAATIFVVVVSVGVAIAVGWAKWATTPTFGVASDYISLVVETVGSATIAGLASVLVVLARRRFA